MIKQRALSVGERIMYVNKQQPINCLFAASIRGTLSLHILTNALAKLQKRHPLLRSTICEDDYQPYFTLKKDIKPIPIVQFSRDDDDHWKTISKAQWHTYLDTGEEPLAKLVWVKGNEISELILICPHCIADGVSMTTLLGELFILIDNLEYELEDQLFIEELSSPLKLSGWGKINLALKGYLGKCLARFFLPNKVNAAKILKPEASYMVHHRLNEQDTKKILRLCKSRGASLYTIVGACLLKAYQSLFPDKFKGKLICPVDIRKFLTNLKEDQLFAFAPIIELGINKKSQNSIWHIAKEMKNDISKGINKINIAEILKMSEEFQPMVPKLINHLLTKEGTHDFTFSNMGSLRIQEVFKTFEVMAIYSPTVSFPWRNPNTIVVSSYRGILDLTFMSNEAVLTENEANVFIKTTFNLLTSAASEDSFKN